MKQMKVPKKMQVNIDLSNPEIPESARVLQPIIFHDGDAFCVVLGEDPQEGVFGCGKTEIEALKDWDMHLEDRIKQNSPNDDVLDFIHLKRKKNE